MGVGALALKRVPGLIHPEAVHADQPLAAVASKHAVCLLPFLKLMVLCRSGALGLVADPAFYITLLTGYWTLQSIGDHWLTERRSLLLQVPSVLVLVNP